MGVYIPSHVTSTNYSVWCTRTPRMACLSWSCPPMHRHAYSICLCTLPALLIVLITVALQVFPCRFREFTRQFQQIKKLEPNFQQDGSLLTRECFYSTFGVIIITFQANLSVCLFRWPFKFGHSQCSGTIRISTGHRSSPHFFNWCSSPGFKIHSKGYVIDKKVTKNSVTKLCGPVWILNLCIMWINLRSHWYSVFLLSVIQTILYEYHWVILKSTW